MTNTSKIVPELRFPEFENDREWVAKNLGDIGRPLMCKRIFKEQTTANASKGIPFYKIGTFGKVADSYIPIGLYNEYKSKFSFPKIGEILISASGTIGRLVIYDSSPAYFQDSNIVWLGNNEELVLNSFLFYCYSTFNWQTSDGGVIRRLYNSDLKNMQIFFPKGKIEQQKIANCLSSLDNLIGAETEKLNTLKDHKKGLLQQLFPADGETVPQGRFPEFVGDGEWEERKLGEVLNGESSQIAKNKLQLVNEGYPVYGADGLIGFIESYSQSNTYIAIVKDGSGVGNLFLYNGKSSILGTLTYLKSKNDKKYNIIWFFYLLQRIDFSPYVKGSGIPHIYYKDYTKKLIRIPSSIEQQKIANCLTSLDELITAETEKIESLKEHKKGLMQQLFPQNSLCKNRT